MPVCIEQNPLPAHLKYIFLGENDTLLVIVSSKLAKTQEDALISMLNDHKKSLGWTLANLRGISPSYCMHKIRLEEGVSGSVEHQRRLNLEMKEVVKKEVIKELDTEVVYPIFDSSSVSPVQFIPQKRRNDSRNK